MNKKRILQIFIGMGFAPLAMLGMYVIVLTFIDTLTVVNKMYHKSNEMVVQVSPVQQVERKIFLGEYEITAYCPCAKCCGRWADGIFADGTFVEGVVNGVVVAAPKGFPFGVRLSIEDVGEVIVRDRGGAIKGKRLDLFFQTHQEALEFGRVKRLVWLIEVKK